MTKKKGTKNSQQEKLEFSIDVKKEDHPLGDKDKQYFWIIFRTNNGCSCVYTSGWAINSEEAWKEANYTYERMVKDKNK